MTKKINHKGTVELQTNRLILRKLNENDLNSIFNNWASNDCVTKYLPWNTHMNINETKEILGIWIDEYKNNTTYNWGIVIKETDTLIGTITITFKWDNNYSCEVGYCIGESYWGNGYVNEALSSVVKFMIKEVGYNRIQAKHHVNNINSGKVMLKCGMTFEGILRNYTLDNKGNPVDVKMYSIIKNDLI